MLREPSTQQYRVVHARAKGFLTTREASPGATFAEAPIDGGVMASLEDAWEIGRFDRVRCFGRNYS